MGWFLKKVRREVEAICVRAARDGSGPRGVIVGTPKVEAEDGSVTVTGGYFDGATPLHVQPLRLMPATPWRPQLREWLRELFETARRAEPCSIKVTS